MKCQQFVLNNEHCCEKLQNVKAMDQKFFEACL